MNIFRLCNKCMRKKRNLTPMTKAPIPTEFKCQKGNMKTQRSPKKFDYTATDLGRSDEVTRVTELVWLTGLRAQPSHFPQQSCNQKDTNLNVQ